MCTLSHTLALLKQKLNYIIFLWTDFLSNHQKQRFWQPKWQISNLCHLHGERLNRATATSPQYTLFLWCQSSLNVSLISNIQPYYYPTLFTMQFAKTNLACRAWVLSGFDHFVLSSLLLRDCLGRKGRRKAPDRSFDPPLQKVHLCGVTFPVWVRVLSCLAGKESPSSQAYGWAPQGIVQGLWRVLGWCNGAFEVMVGWQMAPWIEDCHSHWHSFYFLKVR